MKFRFNFGPTLHRDDVQRPEPTEAQRAIERHYQEYTRLITKRSAGTRLSETDTARLQFLHGEVGHLWAQRRQEDADGKHEAERIQGRVKRR